VKPHVPASPGPRPVAISSALDELLQRDPGAEGSLRLRAVRRDGSIVEGNMVDLDLGRITLASGANGDLLC